MNTLLLSQARRMPVRLGLCLLAAWFCSVAGMAHAQPAGAEGEYFIHQVQPGDTLIDLASRYTLDRNNWSRLHQANGEPIPTQLPIGLSLRIPFSLIPTHPGSARVTHVVGQVRHQRGALSVGQELAEGDSISTGTNGFVTLALKDGSTITIPPGANIVLQRLRTFQGVPLTDSVFELPRGSLESTVAPEKTGVGRFEVRTPASVTGVRGSRLRVHASEQGSQSEVLSGRARVQGAQTGQAMLQAREGTAVDTGGRMLPVRPLLAAPVIDAPRRGPRGLEVHFQPVPGAAAYLVRVATDAQGAHLLASQQVTASPAVLPATGPGERHVLVRAMDADGVMGEDASQSYEGQSVLLSGDGTPVITGSGLFVTLSD